MSPNFERPESPLDAAIHNTPSLPVEIIDSIIQDVLKQISGKGRTHTSPILSAIASTSHRFRIHANRHRFSTLRCPSVLHNITLKQANKWMTSLTSVVRSHQALVKLAPSSTMMGSILDFTTDFGVWVIHTSDSESEASGAADSESETSESVQCASEDWAFVLDNLFRAPSSLPSSSTANQVYHFDFLINYFGSPGNVSWNTITPAVRESFLRLLRFSNINKLSLCGIDSIPTSLLRGSGIKHLALRQISTVQPDADIIGVDQCNDACLPPQVESLQNNDGEAGCKASGPFPVPLAQLPCVLKLEAEMHGDQSVETLNDMLKQTPNLVSLRIQNHLLVYPGNEAPIVRYSHLTNLRSLVICCERANNMGYLPVPLRPCLQTPPPSLSEVYIRFKMGPKTLASPENYLDEFGVDPELAVHLAHPCFRGVSRIVFDVELRRPVRCDPKDLDYHVRSWKLGIEEKMRALLEKRTGVDVVVTTTT
ncbi:hypothetical protein JR316_0008336 [Psilocybe cubensis]|uniref:Uncharacterized protein n=2 Tax=Psilocybe cubensis TaxID=181762 RepID=A0A8H8CJ77_PSICU|nr:hypothetical protein JR316_0008336 [Psilocybe cubensis]KAH9479741.1 hypothetical protein JR316_0008336 [Psilocybe cubensis]